MDQLISSLIAFARRPSADRKNDSAVRKLRWPRKTNRRICEVEKIRIKRPGKPANVFGGHALNGREFTCRVRTGSEYHAGAAKGFPSERRQRLPDFNSVRAYDDLRVAGEDAHGGRDRREIGMRGENDVWSSAGKTKGSENESRLAAGETPIPKT